MKAIRKFNELFVEYIDRNFIRLDWENYEGMDCHENCVLYHSFKVYGIPKNLKKEEKEELWEGPTKKLIPLATITGTLILCDEIFRRGEEPLLVCDDLDGDLEYAMSTLTFTEGLLNEESGDPYQNVYYLDEITLEEGYKDDYELKERILMELENLVFSFLHVSPDLIVHYPLPIREKIQKEEIKDERVEKLTTLHQQKVDAIIAGTPFFTGDKKEESSNVVSFGERYEFNEEELSLIYPDDNEPPYPEEAKNQKEFELFLNQGYFEVGNSRLLCLSTYGWD